MASDVLTRLWKRSAELERATAFDDPERRTYLNVVAKLSHEDAKLMKEAADLICSLNVVLEGGGG